MAKTTKKSYFLGKVKTNAERIKSGTGGSLSHLDLSGVNLFIPDPDSKAWLDFLPYKVSDPHHPDRDDEAGIARPGDLWYKRPYKLHKGIGSSNQNVVCLTSIGSDCPICNYRNTLIRKGAPKEEVNLLKPSLRNLYVVVPRNSSKYASVPHVFDFAHFLFQTLLAEEISENEEYEVFPDPELGYTLRIRFDAKTMGGGKPFPAASRIDFLPRDYVYTEDVLNSVPDLDKLLIIYPYKKLESIFFEMDTESDDFDESTAVPVYGTKFRSPQRNVSFEKIVEEDEDEDVPLNSVPVRRRSSQPTKCPHGHRMGSDVDKFEECSSCSLWDECVDMTDKAGDK